MNIIWLSANKFGYELLNEACQLKDTEIKVIITLNEKSKTKMYDGIDNKLWYGFGIKVYEINRVNDEKELIESLKPDFIIMCGWRQIIDKKIIDIPRNGFIGFHPTLLPIGRGSAPIINSILEGFTESGVSMFYVSEGLDNGDIIGQERFEIDELDHAADVYEKVINAGRKLIRRFLPQLINGTAPRHLQDEAKATVFNQRSLKDNLINLEKETVEDIFRKIKALSKPYDGAYIMKDGKKLKILKAELEK